MFIILLIHDQTPPKSYAIRTNTDKEVNTLQVAEKLRSLFYNPVGPATLHTQPGEYTAEAYLAKQADGTERVWAVDPLGMTVRKFDT